MKKPNFHILVCNSYRISGSSQGACNKKNAPELIQYLTEGAADRGLDVAVASTGCLNVCAQRPIVVVHRQNVWYGSIETEVAMDELLDAIENGEELEKFKISE